MERASILNLNAGPSSLPLPVLERAAAGLLNYEGTGMGITEISHRSPEFRDLTTSLQTTIRTLLSLPPTHEILFVQGGASLEFSAIPLNLLARFRLLNPDIPPSEICADYVVTGGWSKKAADEAKRMVSSLGVNINIAADGRKESEDGKSFTTVPSFENYHFSEKKKTAWIYYCENETVHGVQFASSQATTTAFPLDLATHPTARTAADLLSYQSTKGEQAQKSNEGGGHPTAAADDDEPSINPPIIADFSSSFLSRPIPHIERYGMIYGGAQKNIGPAGLTILLVRKDLLVDVDAAHTKLGCPPIPLTLSLKVMADNGSLYNTPPMFPMYVSLLVLRDLEGRKGGLEDMEEANYAKQEVVYGALERLERAGLVRLNVKPGSRSWMNVTFVFLDPEIEKKFVQEAEGKGFRGVKGHR
jgi:phosphoserine aminotransferase